MSIEKYIKEFPSGTIIFSEGDPGTEMYVIKEGKVRIEIAIKQRDKIVYKPLDEISVGEFFGEMALIDDLPRTARAKAIEYTQLVGLNKNRFYKLIEDSPEFAIKIVRRISNRLKEANVKLKNLGLLSKKETIIGFIFRLSEDGSMTIPVEDFIKNIIKEEPFQEGEIEKILKQLESKNIIQITDNTIHLPENEHIKLMFNMMQFIKEEI